MGGGGASSSWGEALAGLLSRPAKDTGAPPLAAPIGVKALPREVDDLLAESEAVEAELRRQLAMLEA